MKILLVEDDAVIGKALSEALSTHHYIVNVATDGQTGLGLAEAFEYDLILLDVLLPKLDGISVCRQLRNKGCQKPILLLTAKDSSTDRVAGLDAGADDYVSKPFELSELMARIRALLRRGRESFSPVLSWGDLQLNPVSGEITYQQKQLSLTPTEYKILELFLKNSQRLFSRSAIIDRLWSFEDPPFEAAITTHIKDLRQKLKAAGVSADLIETVYGLGYRLKAPPKQEKSAFSETRKYKQKRLASVTKILERFQDTFANQVAVLEQAKTALLAGSLSAELQQQAKQEAHKLAGSLGTFGYPDGSKVAREIEHLLLGEILLDNTQAMQFSELVVQLQQVLKKPSQLTTLTPSPAAQSPLVLVIDDDVALTEKIKAESGTWNIRVEIAANLTAARSAIARSSPDIILLDLTLDDTHEDGLMLLKELASQTPTLPVLVFTGRDSLMDRVEVARLGGRGFLSKPVPIDQIFQTITQVLAQMRSPEATIMIVDDDPAILVSLSTLLEPWLLRVVPLEDPQQFWEVLTSSSPDLLILDLEMPTFNGSELCQVVRQDRRWGDLPILILTAHTDAQTIRDVFAAGADDFISKPVVGPELITRINGRLERVRLRQQLSNSKFKIQN